MKAIKKTTKARYTPNGKMIREYRLSKRYGLNKTAHSLKISPTYLSFIERGKIKYVSERVASDLAMFLNNQIVPEKGE